MPAFRLSKVCQAKILLSTLTVNTLNQDICLIFFYKKVLVIFALFWKLLLYLFYLVYAAIGGCRLKILIDRRIWVMINKFLSRKHFLLLQLHIKMQYLIHSLLLPFLGTSLCFKRVVAVCFDLRRLRIQKDAIKRLN